MRFYDSCLCGCLERKLKVFFYPPNVSVVDPTKKKMRFYDRCLCGCLKRKLNVSFYPPDVSVVDPTKKEMFLQPDVSVVD